MQASTSRRYSPGASPARVIGSVAFWFIFLFAISAAIGALKIPALTRVHRAGPGVPAQHHRRAADLRDRRRARRRRRRRRPTSSWATPPPARWSATVGPGADHGHRPVHDPRPAAHRAADRDDHLRRRCSSCSRSPARWPSASVAATSRPRCSARPTTRAAQRRPGQAGRAEGQGARPRAGRGRGARRKPRSERHGRTAVRRRSDHGASNHRRHRTREDGTRCPHRKPSPSGAAATPSTATATRSARSTRSTSTRRPASRSGWRSGPACSARR